MVSKSIRVSAIFIICSSTTTALPSSVVSESGDFVVAIRAPPPDAGGAMWPACVATIAVRDGPAAPEPRFSPVRESLAALRRLPDLRAALEAAGLGVEVMDSRAAARTYNVVLAEARRIAAALLPVGGGAPPP